MDLSFMGDPTNGSGTPIPAPGVCILRSSFLRYPNLATKTQVTISEQGASREDPWPRRVPR